jgi:hypothetical protein
MAGCAFFVRCKAIPWVTQFFHVATSIRSASCPNSQYFRRTRWHGILPVAFPTDQLLAVLDATIW